MVVQVKVNGPSQNKEPVYPFGCFMGVYDVLFFALCT